MRVRPMKQFAAKIAVATVGSLIAMSMNFTGGAVVPAHAAPFSLTISSGTTTGVDTSVPGQFTANASPAVLNVGDLAQALNTVGPQTVIASGSITVVNDITATSANALTFKAEANIIVNPGVTIETDGGDITFQSASAGATTGSIRLGNAGTAAAGAVNSKGGDIIFSGGPNPLTGFAYASSDIATSQPEAGVAMYRFTIDTDGGNILIRGSSVSTASNRSVFISGNTSGRSRLVTSGLGTISIVGIGSNQVSQNPWGIQFSGADAETVLGDITFIGEARGAPGTTSNRRGVVITGDSTLISESGDILVNDVTPSTVPAVSGMYFNNVNTFKTAGEVQIRGNRFTNDNTLVFETPEASIKSFDPDSFDAAVVLNFINATNAGNFMVGHPGNISTVTVNRAITAGGPATIHGSTIQLNAALSAPGSVITLHASTAATQTAPLTADSLSLNGAGNFTLTNSSNNVVTLAGGSAGSRLGSVAYTDASGGLTIGTVSPLSGLFASGIINVATLADNLTVNQPVSSTAASGDSVTLFANKPALANDPGNGDIIFSGSGVISISAGARALLYSGTRASSTGLLSEVGGETNARSLVDATTALSAISPPLDATGEFALFRTALPTFTVTFDANGGAGTMTAQSASGSAPLEANTFTREGFVFAGWNTNQLGTGTAYVNEAIFSFSANETLYAQWTLVPTPTPKPTPNVLPDTGGSVELLLLSGASLLAAGVIAAAIATARRRRTRSPEA